MTVTVESKKIMICDDEPHLREMLSEYLGERGYRVVEVENADAMLATLDQAAPDVIVLDINMPGTDGLTALRTMRVTSKVPVIMLSAAGEVIDRIIGLEMGADDYVAKPVDLRELEARIKSALRRKAYSGEPEVQKDRMTGAIPFGVCRLDLDGAKLFGENGEEIAITAMEFSLLRVFAQNRGRVLNRDQLLEQAHDRGWEHFDRSIDLRISRLRRKIEMNPTKPETIRTVRGLGYIFD
ncbi:Transcriptional regulatory protein OmpR [Thalassovita gelatinovora]|uniref:Regulatory protein VirG n=1 Tax=Thalassovita gelatinovora TaxID=53501 RepID=A0A0N7LV54_THAGE|nr:response regulator [Thalassovita gelatinovora]QIZ80729.1 response regulator [Thalassovita gelatinovora]CUH65346.1 Transcriptional regulatory protein OmpR [Thalassovita gelatinovora]SEQ89687.1 two component transcriptional regulator, winged helix family [Thalassovita gelatinovora]